MNLQQPRAGQLGGRKGLNASLAALTPQQQDSFEAAFKQYRELVFRIIRSRLDRRWCDPEQTAHDLTMQTFLKAMKGFPNFRGERGEASFKDWLLAIAMNEFRQFCRRPSRELTFDQRTDGEESAPGDWITVEAMAADEDRAREAFEDAESQLEAADLVDRGLRRMEASRATIRQAEVIRKTLAGMTPTEVAATTSLSLEAVKSLKRRGEANLRRSCGVETLVMGFVAHRTGLLAPLPRALDQAFSAALESHERREYRRVLRHRGWGAHMWRAPAGTGPHEWSESAEAALQRLVELAEPEIAAVASVVLTALRRTQRGGIAVATVELDGDGVLRPWYYRVTIGRYQEAWCSAAWLLGSCLPAENARSAMPASQWGSSSGGRCAVTAFTLGFQRRPARSARLLTNFTGGVLVDLQIQ